jgi:DNA-directed RNA polymerase subunit RPC12/RpoP
LIQNDLSIVVKRLRLAHKLHFTTLEAYTVSKAPTQNSTQPTKETKTKLESTISCGEPNMAAPGQIIMANDFAPFLDPLLDPFLDPYLDPFLDYSLPDMSLDFQGNNWNQFEYEGSDPMSSKAYDQDMTFNSVQTQSLNTEYLPEPELITSWAADLGAGFGDSVEDMFYLPLESAQITSPYPSNDSYSQDTSLPSGYPQQNSLSPSDIMSSTSPLVPPEALYSCDNCARKFEKKNVLKRHKKQHEKPFQCHLCNKRFAENRDMRRHIVVHHSSQIPGLSKPRYLCSESGCGFAQAGFGREDHLTRHMRRAHLRRTP